jgi:nucleotide-binding universal stress UspA family protein
LFQQQDPTAGALNTNKIMHLNILIPTDFSAQSEFAMIFANKIAERIPVAATLLHIIQCKTEARIGADGQVEVEDDAVQGYLQARTDAAHKGFEMYQKNTFQSVKTEIVFGPISTSIIFKSKTEPFDLVLMGTKGAFGIKDIMSGTLTQQVVKAIKTPVLSLMCDRSDFDLKNLLLIHKIHEPNAQIPKVIREIVRGYGAKLHIMQNADAQHMLGVAEVNAYLEEQGLTGTEAAIYAGTVTEQQIVAFDQKTPVDMVAIATSGESSLLKMFSKSVAEKLVNHMFKPIITFHI